MRLLVRGGTTPEMARAFLFDLALSLPTTEYIADLDFRNCIYEEDSVIKGTVIYFGILKNRIAQSIDDIPVDDAHRNEFYKRFEILD